MSSPGFLDFFILEAGEYVEQLDGFVSRAAASGPDVDALTRTARALRGSATMAKLAPFAELATALERVGRALREGRLSWSPAVSAPLTAAVDDLKILIRATRSWSPAEDQRAAARTAELTRLAPAATPTAAAAAAANSGGSFFAAESSNIAAGLELLATRPNDRDAGVNVLRRVRAMSGVAGIKEIAALADILASSERVARPLEMGQGPLDADRIAFLRAAAALLRRVAAALREGASPDVPSPEREAFRAALSRFEVSEEDATRIVPITELFYGDGGPHVVSASPHPPTTPPERFRLEVVSQGEHLRGLVAEARSASTDAGRDRVRRELRHALATLRSDAESFGELEVADLIGAHFDAVRSLDYLSLNALEALGQVLASPGTQGERLSSRLAELTTGRSMDSGIGDALGSGSMPTISPSIPPVMAAAPPAASSAAPPPKPASPQPSFSATAPTPVITPRIRADAQQLMQTQPVPTPTPAAPPTPAPTPSRPVNPRATPRGARSRTPIGAQRVSTPRDTMAVLDQGIDSLSSMAAQPMSDPVDLPEQPLVPIDALLYRGRAAIERAIELREEIRRHGGSANADAMAELFDLLDLALAE